MWIDSTSRRRQSTRIRSATKASPYFHDSPNRTPLVCVPFIKMFVIQVFFQTRKRSRKKLDFSDDSLSRLDVSTASAEEEEEEVCIITMST